VPNHDVSIVSRESHRGPKATTFGEYIEFAKGLNAQPDAAVQEAFAVRK